MKLRVRHLRLRAETDAGTFGADIPFDLGLNVLWADNTKGKSTCMQGMLYALGLERMLSPRREIPLTYVMTSHLDDPETGEKRTVLQSSVSLELENSANEIITVRRNVISPTDTRLISVSYGAALTSPDGKYIQRDFFALDPGAAQREAGFHRMLTEFIGWRLPIVRKYDGNETLLYLETIFPLFYVEQKQGWSSTPAAFPTYFQIRDVGRRAVEFVIGLETHELELRRQQIEIDLAEVRANWGAKFDEAQTLAQTSETRVQGLPKAPTISRDEIHRAFLLAIDEGTWLPVQEFLPILHSRVTTLRTDEIPTVGAMSDETAGRIAHVTTEFAKKNADRNSLFRARQREIDQRDAVERRLLALEEDLQKNLDAQKLQRLGSDIDTHSRPDHCPTCDQPIADSLLAQRVGPGVMTIDDNIEYIRSQRSIFSRLVAQSNSAVESIERELAIATAEANRLAGTLRALREDQVAPASAPSVAKLEERMRLESRLQNLDETYQRFEELKESFLVLAARYSELLAEKEVLPSDRLTARDKRIVTKLSELIREQAKSYGFSTFPADEIEISSENFRPQKEGFEIGFELSASDAIRLKWAYSLAMLELGRTEPTNHPGLVIFDEPRQQETAKISFKQLLRRASLAKESGQQVIFATSEDREQLAQFLDGIDCKLTTFEGHIVKRIT